MFSSTHIVTLMYTFEVAYLYILVLYIYIYIKRNGVFPFFATKLGSLPKTGASFAIDRLQVRGSKSTCSSFQFAHKITSQPAGPLPFTPAHVCAPGTPLLELQRRRRRRVALCLEREGGIRLLLIRI